MRFIYPAVIEEKEDGSFHASFPDLTMCEADGSSMMEVLRNAVSAAHDWIDLELSEEDPVLPPATDKADLTLKENETVRDILVIYRMHEGWDE
jgi:predicted RNase H-like HicB family nuclease